MDVLVDKIAKKNKKIEQALEKANSPNLRGSSQENLNSVKNVSKINNNKWQNMANQEIAI
jgi:hypothetical protein